MSAFWWLWPGRPRGLGLCPFCQQSILTRAKASAPSASDFSRFGSSPNWFLESWGFFVLASLIFLPPIKYLHSKAMNFVVNAVFNPTQTSVLDTPTPYHHHHSQTSPGLLPEHQAVSTCCERPTHPKEIKPSLVWILSWSLGYHLPSPRNCSISLLVTALLRFPIKYRTKS